MIWGLSLHGWEEVMRGSLAIVGVCGLLVGLATTFVVTLTREEATESKKQLEEYKLDAGAKISAAEAVGRTAQADIVTAHARIVEAEARTKEAELKAEQIRKSVRPRGFGMEFFDLVKDELGCPIRISYLETAGDGSSLATQLTFMLPKEKGWVISGPEPISAREPFMGGMPQGSFRSDDFIAPENTIIGSGITPPGISLVIGPGFEPPAAWRDLKTQATPVGALIRAFLASVGSVSYGFDSRLPAGSLRVVIGPRP
jgi:hypothetical protein